MIKDNKSDEIAIKVEHVSKTFRLPHDKGNTIKGKIVNFWRRKKGYEEQVALKDISFEVKKGEFFGIVGRNGSGKSTLLKLISGIYTPDTGSIQVNGKLVPFIELGVGFNPELSGRDNVFLNGALLGFNRKEMEKMYDEIVEFAEIERFMDQKLKNYSSGMQVRLAFSIAIRAKADILVLDEVLAVGDAAFQKKCYDYFYKLKNVKKTVILVTHDMSAVEQFCNRAILIDDSKVVFSGNNREAAQKYRELFMINKMYKKRYTNDNIFHKDIKAVSFNTIQEGEATATIRAQQAYSLCLYVKAKQNIGPVAASLSVVNEAGIVVMSMGVGGFEEPNFSIKKGLNQIEFIIDNNILNDGEYVVDSIIQLLDNDSTIVFQATQVFRYTIYGARQRKHALTHPVIKTKIFHE